MERIKPEMTGDLSRDWILYVFLAGVTGVII